MRDTRGMTTHRRAPDRQLPDGGGCALVAILTAIVLPATYFGLHVLMWTVSELLP